MTGISDQDLLRAFVERRDEGAFAQIVERYARLVHASARRQIHDAHLAEDVTQAVFIMLAQKAGTLKPGTVLAGWLITAARLAAQSALRGELRRKRREAKVAMNSSAEQTVTGSEIGQAAEGAIDGELDDALARLNDQDRAAVTLRYLQNRPIRDVAHQLGISEEAATKRISRAVTKLRDIFSRRGIQLTPVLLVGLLSAQADAGARLTLTAQAIAGAALQSVGAGSATTTAAAMIARDALAGSMLKTTGAIAAVILLAVAVAGVGWAAYQATQKSPRRSIAVAPDANVASASGTLRINGRAIIDGSVTIATPRPIKVGVLVSLNTVNHKSNEVNRNWEQLKVIGELDGDALIQMVPLIEPGTQDNTEQADVLSRNFPGRAPIDASDAESLKQLDVIVASVTCFPQQGVLEAIEAAVQNGTGLVIRQCLGGDENGYAKPVVRRLRGVTDAEPDALMARHPSAATVLQAHPLLGDMKSKVTFPAWAYGAYGKLADGMTPLIQVDNPNGTVFELSKEPLKPHEGFGVYPLAIGQLGKGRLVSCAFAAGSVPDELIVATRRKFGANLVRWAAGRELEP